MKYAFEYRDFYAGKKIIYDGKRWTPATLYEKKNS